MANKKTYTKKFKKENIRIAVLSEKKLTMLD
jgi:hypothetical protein